jgi:aspartate kinase
LAVFTKLKDIVTPISSAEEQQELIEQATGLISDVCNDHVAASKTFVKDPQLREELVAKLKSECQELIEYIMATRRFNLEINSRAKDRVVSFGEKLSCLFMATLLKDSVCCAPRIPLHGLLGPH